MKQKHITIQEIIDVRNNPLPEIDQVRIMWHSNSCELCRKETLKRIPPQELLLMLDLLDFPKINWPHEDRLYDFIEDILPKEEKDGIQKHIDACLECYCTVQVNLNFRRDIESGLYDDSSHTSQDFEEFLTEKE